MGFLCLFNLCVTQLDGAIDFCPNCKRRWFCVPPMGLGGSDAWIEVTNNPKLEQEFQGGKS